MKNNVECAKLLIDYGSDINIPTDNGLTSLHLAILYKQSIFIIKYLLKKGSNIESRTSGGYTPLYYAILFANFETIEALLNYNAKVNIKAIDGLSMFDAAKMKNKNEALEFIQFYFIKKELCILWEIDEEIKYSDTTKN